MLLIPLSLFSNDNARHRAAVEKRANEIKNGSPQTPQEVYFGIHFNDWIPAKSIENLKPYFLDLDPQSSPNKLVVSNAKDKFRKLLQDKNNLTPFDRCIWCQSITRNYALELTGLRNECLTQLGLSVISINPHLKDPLVPSLEEHFEKPCDSRSIKGVETFFTYIH